MAPSIQFLRTTDATKLPAGMDPGSIAFNLPNQWMLLGEGGADILTPSGPLPAYGTTAPVMGIPGVAIPAKPAAGKGYRIIPLESATILHGLDRCGRRSGGHGGACRCQGLPGPRLHRARWGSWGLQAGGCARSGDLRTMSNSWAPPAIRANPSPTPGWKPHAIRTADGAVRPACLLLSEVDTYFQLSPRGAAWQGLTSAEQQIAGDQACRWLKTLCWDTSLDCCDRDFADAWEMAYSELALWLHQNPEAIISGPPDTSQQGTFTKRQKLGDLEIEIAQLTGGAAAAPTGMGPVGPKAPLILQKAPWLYSILGCWLKTPVGSSRILKRCC